MLFRFAHLNNSVSTRDQFKIFFRNPLNLPNSNYLPYITVDFVEI